MFDKTTIQWADSTVSPIMGCGGCELFPPPAQIFLNINQALSATGHKISSRSIYEELIDIYYGSLENPLAGHKNVVNTTNIWHLRDYFLRRVLDKTNDDFAAHDAAEKAIKQSITCHAAKLHLRIAQSLEKENFQGNSGFAPIFEAVTEFPGRATETANLKDLLGVSENRSPWKANLPRLIFVSDLGDAMSGLRQFPFLKNDLIPAITSDAGKRHLWMWLTKRPLRLAEFSEEIGGLPENVCAMTTLTGPNEKNLKRLADLKKVQAHIRGLSIEPLWERIPPKSLDLKGIDWVIVGGESGSGKLTRPFALEWAEKLRDHCRKNRVAFFLKQLGRNPTQNDQPLILKDSHGGNWDEWPDDALKVREFPKAFHNYRKGEMQHPMKSQSNKPKKIETPDLPPTDEEKTEFSRLHQIVQKGVKWYVDAGLALREIHQKKLWRAGDYKTWKDYCESVVGKSRAHVQRLMEASEDFLELESALDTPHMPQNESQVRPLHQLDNLEDRRVVWRAVVLWLEDQKTNAKITAAIVSEMVQALKENELEENALEENALEENALEENALEENALEENALEENALEENALEEKAPEENTLEENTLEENEEVKAKEKTLSRNEKRAEVFLNLQTVIKDRTSWEDAEKLLTELEKLI